MTRTPSEVKVRGAAKLAGVVTQPDGSWIIEVELAEGGRGEYTVQLGDATGSALAELRGAEAEDGGGKDLAVAAVAGEDEVRAAVRALASAQQTRGIAA